MRRDWGARAFEPSCRACAAAPADNNGRVSREEFHRAMGEMKFNVPPLEIDALFDEWDPDGSGALELKEISKLLRRGSTVELDEKLRAGAVELDLDKGTKIAIRKGTLDRNNSVLLRRSWVSSGRLVLMPGPAARRPGRLCRARRPGAAAWTWPTARLSRTRLFRSRTPLPCGHCVAPPPA